jgi:hypothetical protein
MTRHAATYELSSEARGTYVAREIAELIRRRSDLSWADVRAINEWPGWEYEPQWYERYPPHELVHHDRLDDLALMRAWQNGHKLADHWTALLGA